LLLPGAAGDEGRSNDYAGAPMTAAPFTKGR
jgi:hypothetical protein